MSVGPALSNQAVSGSEPVISLEGVRYDYRGQPALCGLSATLSVGVTGILGPNGAGKSTLLRILAGITRTRGGTYLYCGNAVRSRQDASRLRSEVGYLPQSPRWFDECSVEDMVSYFAVSRMGRSRSTREAVASAVEAVGLSERSRMPLGRLSGGQQRRAFLAQSIVHDPKVLVLDEPTAGLDPVQRVRLREHVLRLAGDRVVVWATHIVDDLMSMADTVLVLDKGEVRWSGTAEGLVDRGSRSTAGGQGISAGERGFLAVLRKSGDQDGRLEA